jgi:imidazolonepropionase-like amidohydrolase
MPEMRTLFKNADKLIVGNGEVVENASILVEGNKIIGVGRAVEAPGAQIVNCSSKFIMPGLIDVHVHIAMFAGEVNWNYLANIKDDYLAVRAYTYLNWWIQNGFTTIFEPFARNDIPFELRRALRNGIINGPRLLVSGGGITGTGSMVRSIGPVEVTGAEETRRKVRILASHEYEVDVVKIRTTAEMLEGIVESRLRLTPEEAAAAVDEAHKAGIPVHSHSYGGPGVRLAINAGVQLIIHGQPIGWEFEPNLSYGSWQSNKLIDGGSFAKTDYMDNYALMAEKGIYWAPTLSYYYKIYNEHWDEFQRHNDPFTCGRAQLVAESIERNFRLAHEAGVPIVLGSDTGMPFTYHGDSAWELGLYLKFGMSEGECIEAATLRAAKSLWIDDRTGSLEVGKRADMLILGKDPLADIMVLSQTGVIERVYVDGELRAENHRALAVPRAVMLKDSQL